MRRVRSFFLIVIQSLAKDSAFVFALPLNPPLSADGFAAVILSNCAHSLQGSQWNNHL